MNAKSFVSSAESSFSFVNLPDEESDVDYSFAFPISTPINAVPWPISTPMNISTVQFATNPDEGSVPPQTLVDNLLEINRNLLEELKCERAKVSQLEEKNRSLSRSLEIASGARQPDSMNGVYKSSSSDSVAAGPSSSFSNQCSIIKEEHLRDLANYLQSELTFCKKEMYALNSKIEDKTNLKTSLHEMETQTEAEEHVPDILNLTVSKPATMTEDEQLDLESLSSWLNAETRRYDQDRIQSRVLSLETDDNLVPSGEQRAVENVLVQNEFSQPPIPPPRRNATTSDENRTLVDEYEVRTLVGENRFCPFCDKDIDEGEQLTQHIVAHSEAMERDCPFCLLKFPCEEQRAFEIHVYSHVGEIPAVISHGNRYRRMFEAFSAHSQFE